MEDNKKTSLQYEHEMRVWEHSNNTRLALFQIHINAVIDFSSTVIKSVILANSAAAGASLAFIGTAWEKLSTTEITANALMSTSIFAIGAFLGIIGAMFAYLCQYTYMLADMHITKQKRKKIAHIFAIILHIISATASLAGCLAFAFGAYKGISALLTAKGVSVF